MQDFCRKGQCGWDALLGRTRGLRLLVALRTEFEKPKGKECELRRHDMVSHGMCWKNHFPSVEKKVEGARKVGRVPRKEVWGRTMVEPKVYIENYLDVYMSRADQDVVNIGCSGDGSLALTA